MGVPVAVVADEQDPVSNTVGSRADLLHGAVDRLGGQDGRGVVAGVADHVHVGEIGDHQVDVVLAPAATTCRVTFARFTSGRDT